MTTKTVRSRFSHEVGEQVEGFTILEKRVIIPPDPSERRLGVYDYLVEVPPVAAAPRTAHKRQAAAAAAPSSPPTQDSYRRSTPDQMGGRLIRRLPSR